MIKQPLPQTPVSKQACSVRRSWLLWYQGVATSTRLTIKDQSTWSRALGIRHRRCNLRGTPSTQQKRLFVTQGYLGAFREGFRVSSQLGFQKSYRRSHWGVQNRGDRWSKPARAENNSRWSWIERLTSRKTWDTEKILVGNLHLRQTACRSKTSILHFNEWKFMRHVTELLERGSDRFSPTEIMQNCMKWNALLSL